MMLLLTTFKVAHIVKFKPTEQYQTARKSLSLRLATNLEMHSIIMQLS